MKNYPFIFIIICISVTSVLGQEYTSINEQEIAEIENEIWDLEEIYISSYAEANHKAILSLMHDKFLGWPDSQQQPTDKIAAAKFLIEKYPEPTSIEFEIERSGIQVFGRIVVDHYILHTSWKNESGADESRTTRIIHTWIKENSKWQILGGMSNVH